MYKTTILPAGFLASAIIGAGIFALPFAFVEAGIAVGLFYLIAFAGVLTLIHLMYGDVILRTEENLRFVGYAETYIGKSAKWPATLTSVVGAIFALTVYLIISVSFVSLLIPDLSVPNKILTFWLLGSAGILLKINRLAFSEFLIGIAIGIIILTIFAYGTENLTKISSMPLFNLEKIFFPYGAVLFALAGRTAIPTLLGYFRKNNLPAASAKTPIIIGTVLSAAVYLVFVFGILSVSETVSQDSIFGILDKIPLWLLKSLGILGIISIWSSYIVVGRDAEKSLEHDFGFSKLSAALAIAASPLILYFLGFQSFLELISLSGGVFIGLEGVFIVLMWRKASKIKNGKSVFLKNINPAVIYFLLLVFVGGIIYNIFIFR